MVYTARSRPGFLPSEPRVPRSEPRGKIAASHVSEVLAARRSVFERPGKERTEKKREADARKAERDAKKLKKTQLPIDDYPQPPSPARAPDTTTVEEAFGRLHSHKPLPAPKLPASVAPADARPCDVRGAALFKPQRQKASSRRTYSHARPTLMHVPRIPTPAPPPAPAAPAPLERDRRMDRRLAVLSPLASPSSLSPLASPSSRLLTRGRGQCLGNHTADKSDALKTPVSREGRALFHELERRATSEHASQRPWSSAA